ncbi:AMP-binding protein [Pseudomonas sp. CCI3.2]|uniref:AMP-binding protein n=1 Tax=unclassified Pseudomonas TaxID=196821 RepID=UPI002AC9B48A|nr:MULTISPECIES: AMP-binding protein [unclassified Pseudomonas]MEA9993188.1 AMP-binding protein [Pseudomonas sp. AA4]MEB0076002.1 AMP-binding protein [Pseudomonas sp. MH10out]MEB0089263.1 AMP-binding protein [Pseudomonas sp. RTI1]MEB0092948.1 AMP-binding protein [Pseudomonas sp. CCI4.2]MEB0103967.1 AMP-binding protein [Pseudomonas sp. CCI3.2]
MNRLELDKASILAVIISLLADELKALRHLSSHQTGSERWSASTLIGEMQETSPLDQDEIAIGADSLELLSLATCVAMFFNIYESGLEDYLLRFKTLGEWADLVATARRRGTENVTFATSGSTGTPKQCLQQWDALVTETSFFAEYFGSSSNLPTQRIIALSPCHHIYGFIFSILLPLQLQLPAVIRAPKALAMIHQRKLRAGDLMIGFPFIWRQLSRQGTSFPAGTKAITSTGPCDPTIIRELQNQGIDCMVEVYGSSETAGIGVRSNPDSPFQLLPRWQRGNNATTLAECETGTEYELDDELKWLGQTHFLPEGRRDECVQVGGINVFPSRITERLQSLPEVAAAAVRLMSALEGERLKAFIVPVEGYVDHEALEAFLHAWCIRNLMAVERPKAFTFGLTLPHNLMGKQSDWPIKAGISAEALLMEMIE